MDANSGDLTEVGKNAIQIMVFFPIKCGRKIKNYLEDTSSEKQEDEEQEES